MPTEAVLSTLRDLWLVLQQCKLPCALMGGLALSFWKHPRFTKDVDVLVVLGDADVPRFIQQLAAAGFRTKRADPLLRLANASFVQVLYGPADTFLDVQVDLMLVRDEYQRQAIQRRVPVAASELGFDVDVLACEDLVIHKLLAGRVIDQADAAAVLRANRDTIDWPYLRHWVHEQNLDADFARIWEEAFPGEPVQP